VHWFSPAALGRKISASFLYNGTRSVFEMAGIGYERPRARTTASCASSSLLVIPLQVSIPAISVH